MNKQSTCFLSLSPHWLTSHLDRGTWKIQAGKSNSLHSLEAPVLSLPQQGGGARGKKGRVPCPTIHPRSSSSQTFWLLVTPPFIRFVHVLGGMRHTQISVILRPHRIPWVACMSRKERRLGSHSRLTTNYIIRRRGWWHICEDTTLGMVINCVPPPQP